MPGLFHSGTNQAKPAATSRGPKGLSVPPERDSGADQCPARASSASAPRGGSREAVARIVTREASVETPTATPSAAIASPRARDACANRRTLRLAPIRACTEAVRREFRLRPDACQLTGVLASIIGRGGT